MTLIIGVVVIVVAFAAWRLWIMSRWWALRARSAKVLDEIEMEFVNDDMDVDVLEDSAYSPGGRCRLHGVPLMQSQREGPSMRWQ